MTTAWPGDPHGSGVLGFAGALLLATGGLGSGAVPLAPALPHPHTTAGLITAYLGLALLVAAWWRLGRVLDDTDPGALRRTLILWATPLALGPPLFSRDGYAYLAQGAMVHAGLDVYRGGPADLGGPLAAEVPAVWQHTPTPYGPVFLLCVATVAALTGGHLLAGWLALRLLAVAAVGALAWLVPRLAERCGVPPSQALWLGLLNPLVLLHLVAGAHNDGPMLALLCAGLYAALRRHPVIAALLVTSAALVKAPAALGLPAVAAIWAAQPAPPETGPPRTWLLLPGLPPVGLPRITWSPRTGWWAWARTGRVRLVATLAGTGLVAAAATAVLTGLAGTGYGWVAALRTPVSASSWSVTSVLGRLTGTAAAAVGAGAPAWAVPGWRWVGLGGTAAVAIAGWLLRHRIGAVAGLGWALTALAVLGPATRPWYLLWGVVPLAVAAPAGPARRLTALGSAVLALVVLPSGYPPGAPELALAGTGLLVGVLVLRVLRPWEPVERRAFAGSEQW